MTVEIISGLISGCVTTVLDFVEDAAKYKDIPVKKY